MNFINHTGKSRSPNEFYGSKAFFFQPKLTINQPHDIYEQEADAMADRVMRMPDQENLGQPFFRPSISPLQRMCAHCEEEEKKMQRKELDGKETATNNELESYVGHLNSGGQALPDEVRNFYEPRFGYDFSHVKVHTDHVAAKSAQSINALAYTSGNNIVFNQGQYSPESASGKKLLSHELTHVVQQGRGNGQVQRLKITPTKTFTQGKCGERSVYWNFESGVAAPKGGGYIIQQIDNLENIKDCPAEDIGNIPLKPTYTFWEAWWVAEGDTIQEKHKLGVVDFTDRSARPASLGISKSGLQVSLGKVRFFGKNVTGDLGKEDQLSSDPAIAAVWKPGTKGGVAQSGWLPSTSVKPSWWEKSLDGPKQRWANSYWNCCGEEAKHKSESDASPK